MRKLKTFDSTGTVNKYVGGVMDYETPHFHGAGTVHYMSATFIFLCNHM